MIDRTHLIGFVIAMIRGGDGDLIDQDQILNIDICDPGDRKSIRELRDFLTRLIENYSYLASRRFSAETEGKSQAYIEMYRRRCENPIRKTKLKNDFIEALKMIENDAVLNLLPTESHHSIFTARELLTSTSNSPNSNQ